MVPALFVLVVLPLAIALVQRRMPLSRDTFRTNAGGNGLIATAGGAVAGNVGIGSFLAIHAFSTASPLIGVAVVVAYTTGLVLCGLLAPVIRRRAGEAGAVGLVDLVTETHGIAQRGWIWGPVALVFVLRAAVQLSALGLLLASTFGIDAGLATMAGGGLIALYLLLGGYRAAVGTDVAQALVIVAGLGIAVFGLPPALGEGGGFADLGPYRPTLLIGIALFLPWSAVLAIDNWQRITLARSTLVAQQGFLIGAAVCGGVFAVIALAGMRSAPGADVFADFVAMMPEGMGWIATILFIACIMSSIDTFIMALVVSLRSDRTLMQLRLAVVALMGASTSAALVFDEVLMTVIAAFNTLTALLPTVLAALVLSRPSATSAILSVWAGFGVTLAMGWVNIEIAALAGFAVAILGYAIGLSRVSR